MFAQGLFGMGEFSSRIASARVDSTVNTTRTGANEMATMIVTHRVSNYDSWKSIYDKEADHRAKAGFISANVLRDAADPNKITVVLSNPNLDAAKKYAGSPDLKQTMQNAGVEGPPEIRFLEDVESVSY
jgi:hypothetical protein